MKRLTATLLTCGIFAGAMLPTVLWIDGATALDTASGTTARVNSALANVCKPSTSCSPPVMAAEAKKVDAVQFQKVKEILEARSASKDSEGSMR
jgi:hypothetical protein